MKKKLIALVLIAVMALGLAACGENRLAKLMGGLTWGEAKDMSGDNEKSLKTQFEQNFGMTVNEVVLKYPYDKLNTIVYVFNKVSLEDYENLHNILTKELGEATKTFMSEARDNAVDRWEVEGDEVVLTFDINTVADGQPFYAKIEVIQGEAK